MVQQVLGRQILIENPSSYLAVSEHNKSAHAETDFLSQLVAETGCGLLLDVNNVYVSCRNMGWNSADYMRGLPMDAVGEVHLAGHAAELDAHGERVLIDNHGAPVCGGVWALYAALIKKTGPYPTLVEWDTDVPAWSVLKGECDKASAILKRISEAQATGKKPMIAAAE